MKSLVRKKFCTIIQNSKISQIKSKADQFKIIRNSEELIPFSFKNNMNFSREQIEKSHKFFFESDVSLKHILTDSNINDFKDGIKKNDYLFYDQYRNVPEILILGRSNSGKSSLINKLFQNKKLCKISKHPGKTQNLEFFYVNNKIGNFFFLVDSPGFGYIKGPVVLRKKFNYLIYSYINFGVRLKLILYLINSEHGMTKLDIDNLKTLSRYQKHIQIIFSKVDNLSNHSIIEKLNDTSKFSLMFKNIRQEIILTSSKTGFGLNNLRASIALDTRNYMLKTKNLIDENILSS